MGDSQKVAHEPGGDRQRFRVVARRRPTLDLPIPPTPFVGRDREVAAASALLVDDRVPLVTLTGPGGVGKTRLGLRIATEVAADFRDGVAFVPSPRSGTRPWSSPLSPPPWACPPRATAPSSRR